MAEQNVRIRIAVPPVDVSGIDALTRKLEALTEENRALTQRLEGVGQAAKTAAGAVGATTVQRPPGTGAPAPAPSPAGVPAPVQVQQAQVDVQPGARVEVRRPQGVEVPAPAPAALPGIVGEAPPSREALQRELQAVQMQQGQVDVQTAPRLVDELRRKRQDLERQLAQIQQGERGEQREERLDRPREETPAPARAPISHEAMEGRQVRLEVMRARLQGLETRRQGLQPTGPAQAFGRYTLDRQIAELSERIRTFTQVMQETPVLPAVPEPEAGGAGRRGGGGGRRRPPRRPDFSWFPWRQPRHEPEDDSAEEQAEPQRGREWAGEAARRVGGVAATAGRLAMGGSLATLGVTAGLALLGGTAIQKSLDAMERYEQRVKAVGILNRQLGGGFQVVNEVLDAMRENYQQLIPDTLELIQGFRETGEVAPGTMRRTVEAATGAAVSLGLAPRLAGNLQGRFDRLFAARPDREFPLINVAQAQQRQAYRGLTNEQFLEQVGQIGAIGGYNLPAMSMDLATRLANFIGGMGQRFMGQQANFMQEFAANVGPSGNPLTEAIRHQALAQLAADTPGGIITVGTGQDAEQLNLRRWRDRLKAIEMAPSSPQIWEAYARAGERLGRDEDETLEMMRVALAPGMSRFAFDRMVRETRKPGGSFTALARDLGTTVAAGGGKEVEAREFVKIRLAEDEPTFKEILRLNAEMDKKLEWVGRGILDAKLATQDDINRLLDGLVQAFGDSKTVLETLDSRVRDWAEEYRRVHQEAPAAPPGTAAPIRREDDPGFNPMYNRPRDPDEPVGWPGRRSPSPTTPQRAR